MGTNHHRLGSPHSIGFGGDGGRPSSRRSASRELMAQSRPAVTIETHVVGKRRGVWCVRCSLPAAIAIDVALVHGATLRALTTSTVIVCPECDQDTTNET